MICSLPVISSGRVRLVMTSALTTHLRTPLSEGPGCYAGGMAWEVEFTDQFRDWFEDLDEAAQAAVAKGVEELQRGGPALGRPFVGIVSSIGGRRLNRP
jgi:hypothetical protein